jgi:hypothetical protein
VSSNCYGFNHSHTILPLPDDCFVQMSVSNNDSHQISFTFKKF